MLVSAVKQCSKQGQVQQARGAALSSAGKVRQGTCDQGMKGAWDPEGWLKRSPRPMIAPAVGWDAIGSTCITCTSSGEHGHAMRMQQAAAGGP